MRARLISLCGHPTIWLTKSLTLVGRHQRCDIQINSSRVSRCHCCLVAENGEVGVRDLNSTNGTLINGRSVEAGRLRHDDILSIAHLRYRLSLETSTEAVSMATPSDHEQVEPAHDRSTAMEILPPRSDEPGQPSTGLEV